MPSDLRDRAPRTQPKPPQKNNETGASDGQTKFRTAAGSGVGGRRERWVGLNETELGEWQTMVGQLKVMHLKKYLLKKLTLKIKTLKSRHLKLLIAGA